MGETTASTATTRPIVAGDAPSSLAAQKGQPEVDHLGGPEASAAARRKTDE
jgi:hypothetical protein